MTKDEAILKDLILKYLNEEKRFESDSKIAKIIGRESFEVGYASEQLAESNLVELIEITGRDSERRNEYEVVLLTKGIYFFRHDSFLAQYKTWRNQNNWILIKTIVAVLNAITIISIAALGLYLNFYNNDLKKENIILQKQINEMKVKKNSTNIECEILKEDSTFSK